MEMYIILTILFIIFVFGVVGNGTLVIIFFRHKAIRNSPNTYILSLALADLLVLMTYIPFTFVRYTLGTWPWSLELCKFARMVKSIFIGVSVFTLTALSAERYYAIVKPLKKFHSKPLTVLYAVFIWILATLCALPDAIITSLDVSEIHDNKTIKICNLFPDKIYKNLSAKYMVLAKAVIYYIVPLCIISFFYVLLAKNLYASVKKMPSELQGGGVTKVNARKHVVKMVLVLIIVFFICFLPRYIFMLWYFFHPNAKDDYNNFWHAMSIIGYCMSLLNSCVNPITLYCTSRVFRQYLNDYLWCQRPVNNERDFS